MRPSDFSDQDIIQAGISIAETGVPVSGSRIKASFGYGNVARFKKVWDAHVAAQEEAASRHAALPPEFLREVEAIQESRMAEVSGLAHRLNDFAVKEARQQVALGLASARQQQDALQQELEEAAKALEDAEAQRDAASSQCEADAEMIAKLKVRAQALAAENERLKARLKAAKAAAARSLTAAKAKAASIVDRLADSHEVNKQLITSRS